MDHSDFVQRARSILGKTQLEFSRLLDIQRRTVIRYEKGEKVPKATRLAIVRLLDEQRNGIEKLLDQYEQDQNL